MTINLALTLQPSALGTQQILAFVYDDAFHSNYPSSYSSMATWTAYSELSLSRSAVSMSPAPGPTSGASQFLHFKVSDGNGYTYLYEFNGSLGDPSGNSPCYFWLSPPNFIFLYRSVGGNVTSIGSGTIGTNGLIGQAGACSVDLGRSQIYTSTDGTFTSQDPNSGTPWPHTDLYLDLLTILDSTVMQELPLNIYLSASDIAGRSSSSQVGTWSYSATGPSVSGISPSPATEGSSVTITGINFGASQGGSTVTFNGASATITSWSPTSIVALVPPSAPSGNAVVTVGVVASAGWTFPVTATQSVSGISPNVATVGASVTISGANFGASQGSSTVTFNGVSAIIASWGASSIVATAPSGATTGSVIVTVGGIPSPGLNFTVAPTITNISPTSGTAGTQVTISGSGFGPAPGKVWLGSTLGTVVSWSNLQIVASVASNAASGVAEVQQAGFSSNDIQFTVSTPTISSVGPSSVLPGAQVTIAGSGFGAA